MNQRELDTLVVELAKEARLDAWNAFVEELQVPSELYPALMTNRPELVRLAPRRALTADEAGALYRLIAGLLETNQALRQHAAMTAQLVEDWMSTMQGMETTAYKIQHFANFRHTDAATLDGRGEG